MFKHSTAAIVLTAALLAGGVASPSGSPSGSPSAGPAPSSAQIVVAGTHAEAGFGCWLLFWACRL